MKKLTRLALVLLLLYSSGSRAQQNSKRPNVIIVLTDDQGYGDFSCLGNPVVKTPNIDRFYNNAIRFDNFHVAPLCTPTRGQLMTGLDALHNRASTVLTGRGLMRRDVTTLPEVFRQNGYRTGMFGKWHLGDSYPDRPMDRGFEKSDWFKGWGLLSEIEFDNDYYNTRYMDSIETKQSGKYCTDLWFDEAMKWMGEMADKKQPFFTYIPLNVTHGPFQGPKKNTDEYRDKTPDEATANFFGMIGNMDENMQRLDEWLVNKKLKENTIVIFMTDNGGTGGIKVFNAGMRGQKGSNYDGGHRVPCFVQWPAGNLGSPRTVTTAANIQDWLPTFIDLLGFKLKQPQAFDGVSLKNALRQPAAKADRMLVVQYTSEVEQQDGKIVPRKYDGCVVYNDWRLVGDSELYNIRTDPGQKNNLIASSPGIFKQMHAYYENWWAKTTPGIDKILPIYIGYKQENPVTVNSNSWSGKGVNTQWGVAQGIGAPRGGSIALNVASPGRYKIELSRWPFHLNRDLTIKGPAKAVGGTTLREGKGLPIASGSLSINNGTAITVNAQPGATLVSTEIEMKGGDNSLQAWFSDKDGKDVSGAYYVRITKL